MSDSDARDRPTVSERDREYFRRLGEWEAENARIERERHMARSMAERLEYSWELSKRLGPHLKPDPTEDAVKREFYARAKRLGLLIR